MIGYEGMHMSGESFFNHDKWKIKLNKFNKIIFPNSHSTLYIIIIYAN